MEIGEILRMRAVLIFGLSMIACRDFLRYYWRAIAGARI
jgi:hypothetical protein